METTNLSVAALSQNILGQVRQVIVGKDHQLRLVLAAMLAKGHILLEDIPGVGKTTMALAFSKTLQLGCSRVQFTPDVLPSDVTGYSILDQSTGKMTYQPGAVLCNLFLADELNRATSRTQSALLEAMEEGQVTVDGNSYPVPLPFTVIATQNPTGAAGTQLLPDSQMDRFMIRLSLGYPGITDEINMVLGRQQANPLHVLQPLLDRQTLLAMQEAVEKTYVHQQVVAYTVNLIAATRQHPLLARGASPRATLAVISLSKALAQMAGRDFVVPEDVMEAATHALPHRLLLSPGAQSQNQRAEDVVTQLLRTIPAPRLR
ncbi:MAG: MoxR family ATPase [Ruminococcaceae bacterium]|nr:MoxR family ATPase [Oscillospiraceae bacterium]